MEIVISPQEQKHSSQTPARKIELGGHPKDLWYIVQEGSVADVGSALALLERNGGNINSRNSTGLTALHIATRRNHIPVIRRLLAAGADPDARDGESGWSSLHAALHFGHLAVASVLLLAGASITLEDSKSQTPIDLISGPVNEDIGTDDAVATEVYSWGSGANYQLGTGNVCIQKLPCKVDSLHGSLIKLVSAAKFHSVAVSTCGKVFTWGFGRGGRLGHPDFDIHSGQAAVITPRQVTTGLGSRRVKAIAAAKHHTVIATEVGEVFTWGSNREGQLGYTSVDTQPTPRRVSSLKSKVIAVAAANKHTAVVSESGEVFTWGCNREGQLGYGTSNSGSNYTPRVVDYLKGKIFKEVAVAKYHTVVRRNDGEVYTWGHRLVTPRRVLVDRSLKKSGNMPMKLHGKERLHARAIAAGMVHSLALTNDGTLFYWVSSDPDLRCQQLYSLCQRNIVSISAGKYWSAAVTSTGDVYMWDGKKGRDNPPMPARLHGLKKAASVSVGETHLLILASLFHPAYVSATMKNSQELKSNVGNQIEEFEEDILFDDVKSAADTLSNLENDDTNCQTIPSLKSLCEKVAAESLVEPRNAVQMLEIADALEADELRKHCEEIVIQNLDYIFAISSHGIATASMDVLLRLEKLLNSKSSHHFATPTATCPAIIYSEEDSDSEFIRTHGTSVKMSSLKNENHLDADSFLLSEDNLNEQVSKEVRALRRKLQQIEVLEEKQLKGHPLDHQQIAKIKSRFAVESSLAELGIRVDTLGVKSSFSEVKDGKPKLSKKQRRKSKKLVSQAENASGFCQVDDKASSLVSSKDSDFFQASKAEEEGPVSEEKVNNEAINQSSAIQKNNIPDLSKGKGSVGKKKKKKGGLSMFLSGALDDTLKDTTPPPPPSLPKTEGPAWGGAKFSKGTTSLRDILDEQKNSKKSQISGSGAKLGDITDVKTEGRISLGSFLPSSPIPVARARPSQASDIEKGTPPWASSGTPPLMSRPSLRDIQLQQGKQHQNISHSPTARTTGFAVTSGQGSPSDSAGMNRWFIPEVDAPSSIRSIQIEEKAMKDLKRFYSSVKIVKNQSTPL